MLMKERKGNPSSFFVIVPLYTLFILFLIKMGKAYNYGYNQIPLTYQEKTIIDIINHYQNQI